MKASKTKTVKLSGKTLQLLLEFAASSKRNITNAIDYLIEVGIDAENREAALLKNLKENNPIK